MTAPGRTAQRTPQDRFVLFPIGKRRFALGAEVVTELAKPDRLQSFPHTTPLLSGVLYRRGAVIPVCDVAQVLVGPDAPIRKFYLIAKRGVGSGEKEWTALPVTGECELAAAEMLPPAGKVEPYVRGLLAFAQEIVEVIDLDKLMEAEVTR
jgi:chemotaxis signal transduction protein